MPRPRVPRLRESPDTVDKLWEHGVTLDDAFDVEEIAPEVFRQKARLILRSDGTLHQQPARLRMIGPNRGERMITLIIEYPDMENLSTIVTGYWSSKSDQNDYRQRRGGRR